MNITHIESIDLNLLTVFDAVMDCRNVTRAATRLGMTQPAVSHALKRLRTILADPLFVRTPRGMTPTVLARDIATDIHAALKQVEAVLRRDREFSPETSNREFSIGLSDYASFVMLPPLLKRLAVMAPRITVTVQHANHATGESLLEREAVDVIAGNFPAMAPHLREKELFRDSFLVAGRSGLPGMLKKPTLRQYLRMEHLQISTRGEPFGYVDAVLREKGQKRRVKVTVPHFISTPFLLLQTDMIATEPSRLLMPMKKLLNLSLVEPPFAIPAFSVTMNWHASNDMDAGQRWLRERIQEACTTSG